MKFSFFHNLHLEIFDSFCFDHSLPSNIMFICCFFHKHFGLVCTWTCLLFFQLDVGLGFYLKQYVHLLILSQIVFNQVVWNFPLGLLHFSFAQFPFFLHLTSHFLHSFTKLCLFDANIMKNTLCTKILAKGKGKKKNIVQWKS